MNVFEKAIDLTCELASKTQECSKKHFSFIAKRNTIITFGWNDTWKSHTIAKRHGYRYSAIHSELACIHNMGYKRQLDSSMIMINTRIDKFGNIKMSKPCKICEGWLSTTPIKAVWYTNKDGQFEKMSLS